MQRGPSWLRRAATGVVAGLAATTGISALAATAAHADSTFTFTRIAGADRYATAGAFDTAAFPGGSSTIYLADGLPGHQSDALAGSGWGGVNGYGALLTDNTNTVPANTTSALTANKVKNVVILGGTSAVTQAQQTTLSGSYTVTRIAGANRFDTMQALDDAIPAASVGKDSSGNPTAILAAGNDNHLVDALSAGGVAYGKKFPIILTDSTSGTLSPQAQQVITALGIKHLIVVGGTAAIPASQYSPAPSGVTKVDVEAGADRSATSMTFADFAITNGWASNSKMELARGDDGADALASSPYAGTTGIPTIVTNSPSDAGSAPAFAAEHKATLTGASVIAGGTAAVPDSQASAVATAGGGSFPQTTPSSVTALPQLVGAKVLGTTTPNQVSATTPAGTTVQYTFSSKVASVTATDFLIYPFNWDNSGATSSCSGAQPPAAIAGAPKLSGCAASIESSGTAVDVLFPYVSNNPSAPANQVPSNYTLATVIKGAVTTTAGTSNPEGSASIGSSSNNTTTATANTTSAPDLTGVTFNAVSSNTTQTPTNFTFDKAAFLTTGGAAGPLGGSGVNATASGAPVIPTGQTPGFFLVYPNNVAVQCDTQGVGSTTAGGGTVAGGNGTTTITVMCANAGGAAAGGVPATNGTADSTGNVARAFVGVNTVTTNTATAAATCPATGGAVSTTVFCNPLQAFHFGNSTTAPDLVSVTGEPAGTNGNADTTRDAVLYTFDQNANTAVTSTAFGVFQGAGNEIPSIAASAGTAVGGNVNQVLAYFTKGTLNGTAAGSTSPAVGAYANGGATGPVAYTGTPGPAPSGGTTGNQPDEMGLTPSTTSTTVTPGTVDGPQLASVALSQVTTPAQTQSFVATYTFTQPVSATPANIDNTRFWLYLKDGTALQANAASCAASSSSATNASITCGAYTVISSPTGVTLGAASSAQIGSAVLGTVIQDAVVGTATGFTAKNPEGAANTTGHT